jgi:hypothetical protein
MQNAKPPHRARSEARPDESAGLVLILSILVIMAVVASLAM